MVCFVCLGKKKHFLGICPDSFGLGEWRLAGVGFFPPANGLGILAHRFHIGLEISTCVFEVGNEVSFSFDLNFMDRKILDMSLFNLSGDARPWISVELTVVIGFFRLQPCYPTVSFGGFESCYTGATA